MTHYFSIFEIGMLMCFGFSWPFAVIKTYKTKNVEGKSILFLSFIFIGYILGTFHKLFFNYDQVIYLYILYGLFVFTEIMMYFNYKKSNKLLKKA